MPQQDTSNEDDQGGMLVYVANAGDCRAVLSYHGIAYDLSEDHKAIREDEQERVTAAGGYVHNGRLMGILAVSRAFGDIEYKQLKEKAWETEFEDDPLTAEPDVRAEVISAGSEFIILGKCPCRLDFLYVFFLFFFVFAYVRIPSIHLQHVTVYGMS
jgi:serine/threonine protein phosphatase PrpC